MCPSLAACPQCGLALPGWGLISAFGEPWGAGGHPVLRVLQSIPSLGHGDGEKELTKLAAKGGELPGQN